MLFSCCRIGVSTVLDVVVDEQYDCGQVHGRIRRHGGKPNINSDQLRLTRKVHRYMQAMPCHLKPLHTLPISVLLYIHVPHLGRIPTRVAAPVRQGSYHTHIISHTHYPLVPAQLMGCGPYN